MNHTDGIKWCMDKKGKNIKTIGSREEFLLCSKALEIYKAGVLCGAEFAEHFNSKYINYWQNWCIPML
jgi:hypothetical protein